MLRNKNYTFEVIGTRNQKLIVEEIIVQHVGLNSIRHIDDKKTYYFVKGSKKKINKIIKNLEIILDVVNWEKSKRCTVTF